MKYEIDYEGLKGYLQTLKETDFQNDCGRNPNGIILKGFDIEDKEYYGVEWDLIPESQIIKIGQPFLVDAIGNDLSICKNARRGYKLPTGRIINAKFDRTIIDDCRKIYGTPLNNYWIIPEQFIKYSKHGEKIR